MIVSAGRNGSAILLMLPRDFSSRLVDWGAQKIPSNRLSGLPNKGYDKSPHITLATGIVEESPERVYELMGKEEPFSVSLGPVDCFRMDEKGYDVIKLPVQSQNLHRLNQEILGAVEMNNPVHEFSPHITIAYVKPHSCEDVLGNKDFAGMELPVEGFVYSDRHHGGRMVRLKKKQGEPLKESLDYGFGDIAEFLKRDTAFVRAMSAVDIGRTIIAMQKQ